MVNEFLLGTSQPVKQDYLFRTSVSTENFSLGRTKKTFTICTPTGISGNLWSVNGKQSLILVPLEPSELSVIKRCPDFGGFSEKLGSVIRRLVH